jgi:hypothetical protein
VKHVRGLTLATFLVLARPLPEPDTLSLEPAQGWVAGFLRGIGD